MAVRQLAVLGVCVCVALVDVHARERGRLPLPRLETFNLTSPPGLAYLVAEIREPGAVHSLEVYVSQPGDMYVQLWRPLLEPLGAYVLEEAVKVKAEDLKPGERQWINLGKTDPCAYMYGRDDYFIGIYSPGGPLAIPYKYPGRIYEPRDQTMVTELEPSAGNMGTPSVFNVTSEHFAVFDVEIIDVPKPRSGHLVYCDWDSSRPDPDRQRILDATEQRLLDFLDHADQKRQMEEPETATSAPGMFNDPNSEIQALYIGLAVTSSVAVASIAVTIAVCTAYQNLKAKSKPPPTPIYHRSLERSVKLPSAQQDNPVYRQNQDFLRSVSLVSSPENTNGMPYIMFPASSLVSPAEFANHYEEVRSVVSRQPSVDPSGGGVSRQAAPHTYLDLLGELVAGDEEAEPDADAGDCGSSSSSSSSSGVGPHKVLGPELSGPYCKIDE